MTVIERLYAGFKLREDELKQLAYGELNDHDSDLYEEVDMVEYEERRWTRDVETIFKIRDDLWAIPWGRGLTECQENEFWWQPYRVIRKTRTITQVYYEKMD